MNLNMYRCKARHDTLYIASPSIEITFAALKKLYSIDEIAEVKTMNGIGDFVVADSSATDSDYSGVFEVSGSNDHRHWAIAPSMARAIEMVEAEIANNPSTYLSEEIVVSAKRKAAQEWLVAGGAA